jgi:protein arginine N-methyltransferase 1
VDIILSEWMGYFLLRESMLDSLVRARDTFLKPKSGLMMPSHATMLLAPIKDEEERRIQHNEYAAAMEDWKEFAETTSNMYGVDMSILEKDFDREQKEYYVLSSRWAELGTGCLLAEPCVVKEFDMHVCTVEDARGVGLEVGEDKGSGAPFDFDIEGKRHDSPSGPVGPISGFAGWFTVDFKSRTDDIGKDVAPQIPNPAYLSTGPEMGYTHWGQQVFHLPSAIPLLADQSTRINGTMEMMRTKESARLYNTRFRFATSRRKTGSDADGNVLMRGEPVELVYQIP